MNVVYSLIAVGVLILVPVIGAGAIKLDGVFGIFLPYAAAIVFIAGVVWRIYHWAKSPVPFRIPTTGGQGKSLPWIKNNNLESPHNMLGVIGRMALEVFFFRSLFRNTQAGLKGDASNPKLVYGSSKYLWAAGLAFHYAFLIILIRHMRFFIEPIPSCLMFLEKADSFFQIGMPILYGTDILLVAAVTFLFLRRIVLPQIRYISLMSDYFPLFLILAIGLTGGLMRYCPPMRVDVAAIKELSMGLITFSPFIPEVPLGAVFYVHLFLVCALFAYFPFSKLMHAPGVFFSPTRNLANNNRMKRHINPWNAPVKTHSYEEYEDEFRDKMKAAGLPLEKDE